MKENIFKLENVSGGYGGKEVIRDLSLEIARGAFSAIIGPNGAGKSTLLKLMTGAVSLTGGKITFREKELQEYHRKEFARQVSVVEQSLENISSYTVFSFVSLGLFPHRDMFSLYGGHEEEAVIETLKECGIENLAERRINHLSGGELQLVSIARALVQSRDVILLDEPVSHLDIRHSIAVMDLLYDLNIKGATIITVLHDINLASDYCSRILGLKEGILFLDGPPEKAITYDEIEKLFDQVCIVRDNPITGSSFTYPVPEYIRRGKKKGDL